MEQTKVLLLVLAVLLPMKGTLSQICSTTTAEELAVLKLSGGGPLGAFNKEYMALTQADAAKFTNLVSDTLTQHTNLVGRKKSAKIRRSLDKSFPNTIVTGPCGTAANRPCSSCPATTDLGPEIIPRYINEVICEFPQSLCNGSFGLCETTVVRQTFLHKTGQCDGNGHEIMEEFVQDIRACCECFLF